jgi:hypothetical protein
MKSIEVQIYVKASTRIHEEFYGKFNLQNAICSELLSPYLLSTHVKIKAYKAGFIWMRNLVFHIKRRTDIDGI